MDTAIGISNGCIGPSNTLDRLANSPTTQRLRSGGSTLVETFHLSPSIFSRSCTVAPLNLAHDRIPTKDKKSTACQLVKMPFRRIFYTFPAFIREEKKTRPKKKRTHMYLGIPVSHPNLATFTKVDAIVPLRLANQRCDDLLSWWMHFVWILGFASVWGIILRSSLLYISHHPSIDKTHTHSSDMTRRSSSIANTYRHLNVYVSGQINVQQLSDELQKSNLVLVEQKRNSDRQHTQTLQVVQQQDRLQIVSDPTTTDGIPILYVQAHLDMVLTLFNPTQIVGTDAMGHFHSTQYTYLAKRIICCWRHKHDKQV